MLQRSDEWYRDRCGSLGASQIGDALARTKTGWGASRANVLALLVCERLTGITQDTYTSAAMQRGIDTETEARAAYALDQNVKVQQVGLIKHPTIAGTHASPDGLIGDDGLVELKVPNSSTHIESLLGNGEIDRRYYLQVMWQMSCTGRSWCDLVSYDPRLPLEMQLWIKRVPRDDKVIATLEDDVRTFLKELEAKLHQLRERYKVPA